MADMTRLIALVPYYIDLIGRYKVSSQVSYLLLPPLGLELKIAHRSMSALIVHKFVIAA